MTGYPPLWVTYLTLVGLALLAAALCSGVWLFLSWLGIMPVSS